MICVDLYHIICKFLKDILIMYKNSFQNRRSFFVIAILNALYYQKTLPLKKMELKIRSWKIIYMCLLLITIAIDNYK